MANTGHKVLVIEDEAIVAQTLVLLLEREGYEVRLASNGRDAIAQAMRFCPDLLLCDVVLGDMTGFEVARQLRQHCPLLEVVFLSGQAQTEELLQEERERGAEFHVHAKPIPAPELLAIIRQHLPTGFRADLGKIS